MGFNSLWRCFCIFQFNIYPLRLQDNQTKWKLESKLESHHSKWDLVGYSGGSPGLENAVKRWGRLIGLIFFCCLLWCKPVVVHLRVNSRVLPSMQNVSLWKSTNELWKMYKQSREIPLWSSALLQHGGISNFIKILNQLCNAVFTSLSRKKIVSFQKN